MITRLLFILCLLLTLLFAVAACSDDGKGTVDTSVITRQNTFKTIKGIECVLVKKGSFYIEDEQGNADTQRKVVIERDFWISRHPITQKTYKEITDTNHSRFKNNPNNPVENISWQGAVDLASLLDGRLPSEAEWEYAARGGQHKRGNGRIFSGSDYLREVGWYYSNSGNTTKPVGMKSPNELGIFDMSGNVWEWCSNENNPWFAQTPGAYRTVRGGSWGTVAENCKVAHRFRMDANTKAADVGVRIVFDTN